MKDPTGPPQSGTLVYVVDVPAPAPAWVDASAALHPAGELTARSAAVDLSSTGALALVDVALVQNWRAALQGLAARN